jgi:RimJ/RimL family protein N-acetyltransferase
MSSSVTIRPAIPTDRDAIAAFTASTFEWGDYVADAFEWFLEQPASLTVVAVDETDQAIAMSRARIVSPTEAWFHAARVREDHRGRGLAGEMASVLRQWAAEQGAVVGRLLIENWNEASIRHVEKTGFRKVVSVVRATRAIGEASPNPDGNGGRRVPSRLRARPAHAADAPPAYSSWAVGELGRAMRGLAGGHWTFARLTVEHLAAAARAGAFWEIGSGWAVAETTDGALEVGWLETRPEDAADLLRALIDLAISHGVEAIAVWMADIDWMQRSARRLGFEVEPMAVYATELQPVEHLTD